MRVSRHRRLSVLAAAFLSAGFGATLSVQSALGQTTTVPTTAEPTPSDTPTMADLQRQIQSLQTQVQTLSEKQDRDVARDAKEQDETVARVLADARHQSDLVNANGVTAGWEKGKFFLQSADKNFYVHPWLQSQFRYGTAYRDGGKANGSDDTQSGFEVRRIRFGIDGNLFSQQLTYMFNFNTFRGASSGTLPGGAGTVGLGNGGEPFLEEAWLKYDFANTPWSIRAGQIHDPFNHESLIGSKYRNIESSLTTDIFANGENYVQGVTGIYDPKTDLRFEGGFTDGIRSTDTNFEDFPNNGIGYDFGFAGRVEYKLMGDWKDYKQLTALGDTKELLVVGAGLDESQGGASDTFSHVIDVQYDNPNGFSAFAAYTGRYTSDNRGIPLFTASSVTFSPTGSFGDDTYEYSLLGQAAYLLEGKYEPYARFEYMHLAGTPLGSNNQIQVLSAGVNYYLYGHNAKLSGQVMYLPNGIPITDDSNDTLINSNRGEFVFMAQFQLLL